MLNISNVTKSFGNEIVIGDVSLDIEPEESMVVLGPSGCGKTTLLRLIAGFETPDDGTIAINGQTVSSPGNVIPPHRRNIGFVFQDLALWPHLTVRQNIEFGLRAKGFAAERRLELTETALEQVSLIGHAHKYPRQLSGGEQQRVALARAIVCRPGLLLFDEPLANLEPGLRNELCSMVREMNTSGRITSVYVTHSHAEAFLMADRLAIMKGGRIVQIGDPDDVTARPADRFVADFLNG